MDWLATEKEKSITIGVGMGGPHCRVLQRQWKKPTCGRITKLATAPRNFVGAIALAEMFEEDTLKFWETRR